MSYVIENDRRTGEPFIQCLHCGLISYNPGDIANKYCGSCHEFLDQATSDQAMLEELKSALPEN